MTSALAPPPRASAHLRSDKYLRFLVQKVSGCCAERFDQFLRDGSDRVGDVGQWAGSGFRTQWVVCSGFPLLLRELILRTFLRKYVINNTEKMYFRSSSRWKTVLMINVPVFFLKWSFVVTSGELWIIFWWIVLLEDTIYLPVSLFQFSSLEVLSVWLDSSEAGSLLPMQCILYASLTDHFHLWTHSHDIETVVTIITFISQSWTKLYLCDDVHSN